jgi:hypothetical protein
VPWLAPATRPAGRVPSWVVRHVYPRCGWATVRGHPDRPAEARSIPASKYTRPGIRPPFPLWYVWFSPRPHLHGLFALLVVVVPPGRQAPEAPFPIRTTGAGTPYYLPLIAWGTVPCWQLLLTRPGRWQARLTRRAWSFQSLS